MRVTRVKTLMLLLVGAFTFSVLTFAYFSLPEIDTSHSSGVHLGMRQIMQDINKNRLLNSGPKYDVQKDSEDIMSAPIDIEPKPLPVDVYKEFQNPSIGEDSVWLKEVAAGDANHDHLQKRNTVIDDTRSKDSSLHYIFGENQMQRNKERQGHAEPKLKEPSIPQSDMDKGKLNPNPLKDPCLKLLKPDNVVRSCITGSNLGLIESSQPIEILQPPGIRKEAESPKERQSSFQKVFDTRAWGHGWDTNFRGLNASGRGATLDWAQETLITLHNVITELKVQLNKSRISILDVPCGDMQWMSRFLQSRDDVEYTGMDIVPDLINHHKEKFKDKPWKFIHQDVLSSSITPHDLVLNRMMMQHLHFRDVIQILHQFSTSGSKYLLSTTHSATKTNTELHMNEDNPGRYRELNMEVEPISLVAPLCLQNDGPLSVIGGQPHYIGLWQLPLRRTKHCSKVHKHFSGGSNIYFYSCQPWGDIVME